MFETPRIVPHEVTNEVAQAPTETREIDMSEYGECYDPKYKPSQE